jgi:phenylpropionate dioxygenase-like ring-hydroxylating dioxygenase large terminal subunit
MRQSDGDHGVVPDVYRLSPAFIPRSRYHSADYLKLEREQLFTNTWLAACRMEEVENPGSFLEFDVTGRSILIVRDGDGELRVFHNTCRHRGTRLATGRGRTGKLICPFHGWRWNLDGSINYVLDPEQFTASCLDDLTLMKVPFGTWGGWIFINLGDDPEPLDEYLDPLPNFLELLELDKMRLRWSRTTRVRCNWKHSLDAFSEAYHVAQSHPQLVRKDHERTNPPTLRELENRYAVEAQPLGRHSRWQFRPRPGSYSRLTDDLDLLANRIEYVARAGFTFMEQDVELADSLRGKQVPENMTGRQYFLSLRADHMRRSGIEWHELSEAELSRSEGNYLCYPNMIIDVVTQGVALIHRAFPDGDDPESCLFETSVLQLQPEETREHPSTVEPEFYDDWRDFDWGPILNQDFNNMEQMAAGGRSSAFLGHNINTVQEMMLYYAHETADHYLFGAPLPERKVVG